MILRKIVILAAVAASLSAFAGGCQSGGVGDPCTPEDEYQPAFSGFSPSEVNVESRSFQCETRVCLVNHFRGRVSCPLGQDDYLAKLSDEYSTARSASTTPLDLRKYVGDYITGKVTLSTKGGGGNSPTNSLYTDVSTVIGKLCVIPGSGGASPELVRSTVIPQCSARTGDGNNKAVYCSCRCDGDDPEAQYCKCGSGYTCTPFPELTLGAQVAGASRGLTGSYCVLNSDVDPTTKLVKYTDDVCRSVDTFEAGIPLGCTADGNCNGVRKNNEL